MYKNVHSTAEVLFFGAYGECGVCLASIISSGIKSAINKCSSKCIRSSTIIPQYMTYFAIEYGLCRHGPNVSMAV